MTLESLPDRLAAVMRDPKNLTVVGGIAADFATEVAKPTIECVMGFRKHVAPAVDELAGRPADPEANYGRGLLTGLMIVAGVLERLLQNEAAADHRRAMARRPLHGAILRLVRGTAKSNKELSDRLRSDEGQVSRAVRELTEADLLRPLAPAAGGDGRKKYVRLTHLGRQLVGAPAPDLDDRERAEDRERAGARARLIRSCRAALSTNQTGEPSPVAAPDAPDPPEDAKRQVVRVRKRNRSNRNDVVSV
jgi:DNA-binding MarR family transcriptional regulator